MAKGMSITMQFLVGVILLLACFFLILALLIKMGVLVGEDTDLQLCRSTLEIQAKTQVLGFDSPLATNCPKRVVTIGDHSITVDKRGPDTPIATFIPSQTDASKLKGQVRYKQLNAATIDSYFAESMKRCWKIGLEGKEPVLNDRSLRTDKNVCIICDEIHVDTEVQGLQTNLASYLAATNMPTAQDEQTYDAYLFTPTDLQAGLIDRGRLALGTAWWYLPSVLTGQAAPNTGDLTLSGGKACLDYNHVEENPIVESGSYATIFFRYFGKSDYGCMNTYVVPESKVRTLCDYVAN